MQWIFFLSFSMLFTIAPVQVKFLKCRGGKPPLKYNYLEVQIKNSNDVPKWYVFPNPLNEKFDAEGMAQMSIQEIQPTIYEGVKGKKVMYVDLGHDFRAFLLPAQASITIESLMLKSWSEDFPPPLAFSVWEASAILVNDEVLLKDWFPFSLNSMEGAIVPQMHNVHTDENANSPTWNEEKNQPIEGLRTDKVTHLKLQNYKKYKVSIRE